MRKSTFDGHNFRASHDPAGDRTPSLRPILAALAVLGLVGIHWMPVAAWLDGADGRTVGEAVLEMWGLAVVVAVGAILLVLVVLALGTMIGDAFAAITDGPGWPGAEDEDE